jgi:hypothetical protein
MSYYFNDRVYDWLAQTLLCPVNAIGVLLIGFSRALTSVAFDQHTHHQQNQIGREDKPNLDVIVHSCEKEEIVNSIFVKKSDALVGRV